MLHFFFLLLLVLLLLVYYKWLLANQLKGCIPPPSVSGSVDSAFAHKKIIPGWLPITNLFIAYHFIIADNINFPLAAKNT